MTGEQRERDYYYELTPEELQRGLSLTPFERLKRLDDLRRFTIMLRAAPTVRPRAAEPNPAPYTRRSPPASSRRPPASAV